MDTHELKIWPEYYKEITYGRKYFEIRKHDRDFKFGDKLKLKEWDKNTQSYTGQERTVYITYILTSEEFEGLAPGYSALGITEFSPSDWLDSESDSAE